MTSGPEDGCGRKDLAKYAEESYNSSIDRLRDLAHAPLSEYEKFTTAKRAFKSALFSWDDHIKANTLTPYATGVDARIDGIIPREVNELVQDTANIYYLVQVEYYIGKEFSIDRAAKFAIENIRHELEDHHRSGDLMLVSDTTPEKYWNCSVVICPVLAPDNEKKIKIKNPDDILERWIKLK